MAHLWPCHRMAERGWATLGEMATTLTRVDVLEANDMLDAYEEAERETAKRDRARARAR